MQSEMHWRIQDEAFTSFWGHWNQGGHSSGKPGKVREFHWSRKSQESFSPTTMDTRTDTGVIYLLHLLQPQCIKCQILKAHWLPGLLWINVKQRLLTIVLSSISMNLCLPYWNSQGISCGLKSGHPVKWMRCIYDWCSTLLRADMYTRYT